MSDRQVQNLRVSNQESNEVLGKRLATQRVTQEPKQPSREERLEMRAMRKQRSMRGYRYRDSDSNSDDGVGKYKKGSRTRPSHQVQRDNSAESFSDGESGEDELNESKDSTIELLGKLNLVYDRVESQVPNLITKVKLCLKGTWKF